MFFTKYSVSFRCYYPDGSCTSHRQEVLLSEIPHWIECYLFCHPMCASISVKVWFDDDVH